MSGRAVDDSRTRAPSVPSGPWTASHVPKGNRLATAKITHMGDARQVRTDVRFMVTWQRGRDDYRIHDKEERQAW